MLLKDICLYEGRPIFRYVYHVAPKSALNSIQSKGLMPVARSTGAGWQHIKYAKPSIFVATRKTKEVMNELLGMLANKDTQDNQSHDDWTDADWDNFINSYVMLTIDLSKCSNVDLEADPNGAAWNHYMILSGAIPPEAIINVEPVAFDWS